LNSGKANTAYNQRFSHGSFAPLQYDVPDREYCAESITKALPQTDPAAHVVADLHTERVMIGSTANAQDFAEAMTRAGLTVKTAG
jgi:copper chaperone CopZ